jgi:hypothetical protein
LIILKVCFVAAELQLTAGLAHGVKEKEGGRGEKRKVKK